MILTILLQAKRTTNASFQSGQSFGMVCGLLIMTLMVVGAIYVIVKWPQQRGGRFAIGALLLILPFTGVIIGFVTGITGGELSLGALALIPLAWIGWLGLFIYARLAIRGDERRAEQDAADQRAWQQVPVNQPYSAGPQQAPGPLLAPPQRRGAGPAPSAEPIEEGAPVIARCAACMGRWKTTKAEADVLEACPKCGASPPDLRLQRAG